VIQFKWLSVFICQKTSILPGYRKISILSAEASTYYTDYPAKLVYDGDVNTIYHSKEVKGELSTPWVNIHITPSPVDKVVVVNRLGNSDYCNDPKTWSVCLSRLENTLISLWMEGKRVKDCGTIKNIYVKMNNERNQTYVEYCGGDTGDMVKVSRTGTYLHFAEIRIYSRVGEFSEFIISQHPPLFRIEGSSMSFANLP
jgi:hypothetical protein